MTAYQYEAIDRTGSKTFGSLKARDRADALRQLSASGLKTLNLGPVSETKQTVSKHSRVPQPPKNSDSSKLAGLTKIRLSGNQLITFTEELSDLLNSGIQLEPSLKLIEGRQDLMAIAKIANLVRTDIRDGTNFAKALAKASPSFDPLYVNLVAAGEASGSLPILLARHSQYLIKLQELKGKMLTAMIYPVFLLLAGISVTILFLTFLIPRLTVLIESSGSSPPKGVQLISGASDLVKSYWWAGLIAIVAFFIIFKLITSHPSIRPGWDRVKLKLPLSGKIIRSQFQVHFLRSLGNLLENGLSLVDSLKLSFGITSNLFLKSEIQAIAGEVMDGSSLHGSMRKHDCFPGSLADYIRINEQTGSLAKGIQRAADRSERAFEKNIERISALIQPFIIVVIAGVIGMMAYTMISVIYETIEVLRSR